MRRRYPGLDITNNGTIATNTRRGKKWDDVTIWQAYDEIEKYVPTSWLEDRIDEATRRIELAKQKYPGKVTVGWSGGKDALVAERVLRIVGYDAGVAALYRCAKVAEMHEYVADHKPEKIEIIEIGPDNSWVIKNKNSVWGQNPPAKLANFHAPAQREWCYKNRSALHITGRRMDDQNHCGKHDRNLGGVQAPRGRGTVSLAPIYDWWHEEILAAIKYFNLNLAPTYKGQYGFIIGSNSNWVDLADLVGRSDITLFPTIVEFRDWIGRVAPKSIPEFDEIMSA
jgi:3'-phosphoadenosine 5'-phosphosulfate sulfotransferase (PAPS reductase)/FAD synthetase